MSSIKERLITLNSLRKLANKTPLKAWKQSRAKIEEQIVWFKKVAVYGGKTMHPKEEKSNVVALKPATNAKPGKNPKPPVMKLSVPEPGSNIQPDPAANEKRGYGIGAIIKPLILNGLSNKEIFEKIMAERPTLLCTDVDGEMKPTKKWYIAWYRGDLRRKGLLPSND